MPRHWEQNTKGSDMFKCTKAYKQNVYTVTKGKNQTQKGLNERLLIYLNTDTQYANIRGNPLYQATKRHLNNR